MGKILIINSLASNQYLSEILKQNGIHSVCLYTIDFDKLNDYFKPKSNLFDEQIYLPNADIVEIISNLKDMQFDYVLNGWDGIVNTHLTDILAQYFTPQYANDPLSSALRSDKVEMHKQLEKCNLSYIKQLILNKNNYSDFIDQITYPAFIKPRDGDGSNGAMSINTPRQLIEYFEDSTFISNVGNDILEYIIADKVEGEEYLIDTFSINGKHYISVIHKYKKVIINNHPVCVSCAIETDPVKCEKISQYIINTLNATKFNNGVAHIECFYTENDDVVLVEINPRISGAKGSCLILTNYSGRLNQIDIMLNKVFCISTNSVVYDNFATQLILYNGGRNIVPDFRTLNLEKYGVVLIEQIIPAGNFSNESISKLADAAAIAVITAGSVEILERNIELIQEMDNSGWRTLL